ncbi:MAG: hypothetical protein JSR91_01800 [Proteobacteria bacterium]|nr:hypothetical protein [Pseudomonadota bacterium]
MTAWFFFWVLTVGFEATASFWYWALVVGLIATIAVTRLRAARQEANAKTNGEEPVGLGGWLVFLQLYLLFYLFFFARRAIEDLGSQIDGVDLRPEPEWLVYDLALFALLAATTVALLRKQPAFRWLWKIQAAILFCIHAVGAIGGLVSPTPLTAAGPITAAILLAMSWRYVNVSRRMTSIFGGARLTVTPAIRKQECFLKGFAIGFLVFGAGAAAYGLHRGYVVSISGVAGCTLLGLLVGGGASLLARRQQ